MKSNNLFNALLVSIIVILANPRIGVFFNNEEFKSNIIAFILCVALLILRAHTYSKYVNSRILSLLLLIIGCLAIGHTFGRDVIHAFFYEPLLPFESLAFILITILAGYEISNYPRAIIYAAIITLALAVYGNFAIESRNFFMSIGRESGAFEDPNIEMVHLMPLVLLALAFIDKPIYHLALIIPAIFLAIYTVSRTSLFGGAFCLLLFIFFKWNDIRYHKYFKHPVYLFVTSIAIVIVGYEILNSDYLNLIILRIQERYEYSGIFGDRLDVISGLSQLDLTDFLSPIGIGFGYLGQSTKYSHNTFLDVLLIGGSIAFTLYLVVYANICYYAYKINPMLVLGIAFQIISLLTVSVIGWKIHWLILGIYSGIIENKVSIMRSRLIILNGDLEKEVKC